MKKKVSKKRARRLFEEERVNVEPIKNPLELLALSQRLGLSLRAIAGLFALNLLATLLEALGVGMLLPIFEVLRAGGAVDSAALDARYWVILREVSTYTGITITLGLLLSVSFAFLVLRQGARYWIIRSQSIMQRNAADRVRRRIFAGFLNARTALQEDSSVGEKVSSLMLELGRALGALFGTLGLVNRGVKILIYLAGLVAISVPMTMMSVGLMLFAAFLARGYLAEVGRIGTEITISNTQLSTFMIERLQRTRLIRLSGMEKAEAAAFARLSRAQNQKSLRQKLLTTRISLLPEPLALGFSYLMIFAGGQLLGLSIERLAIFVIVFMRVLPLVQGLLADHNDIRGKWYSLLKIDRDLREVREGQEEGGGSKLFDRLEVGIAYENVSFSYPTARVPALTNVSVRLPAHRMSALVGPSGAGKSTFIDLLPRIREPSEGRITLDGTPIAEFATVSLRAGIAFVPQQQQIFNISAADHIRYGKEDATDEEVREAARLAGALQFIERLPQGFDTLLGEGALRLSGGQRQRLDIARALVRRSPILILDEPTSALDAEAEGAFRDALQSLRRETNLTIIVIAHRLSTIADAEQIVVLREGRVEAVGSHEKLLAAGGWYADAYTGQVGARSVAQVESGAA